jgi:hypothetical protein
MLEALDTVSTAGDRSRRYFFWINLVIILLIAVFIAGLIHTRNIFSPESKTLYRLENLKLDGVG